MPPPQRQCTCRHPPHHVSCICYTAARNVGSRPIKHKAMSEVGFRSLLAAAACCLMPGTSSCTPDTLKEVNGDADAAPVFLLAAEPQRPHYSPIMVCRLAHMMPDAMRCTSTTGAVRIILRPLTMLPKAPVPVVRLQAASADSKHVSWPTAAAAPAAAAAGCCPAAAAALLLLQLQNDLAGNQQRKRTCLVTILRFCTCLAVDQGWGVLPERRGKFKQGRRAPQCSLGQRGPSALSAPSR